MLFKIKSTICTKSVNPVIRCCKLKNVKKRDYEVKQTKSGNFRIEAYNNLKLLVSKQKTTNQLMNNKIVSLENKIKIQKIKYLDLQLKFNEISFKADDIENKNKNQKKLFGVDNEVPVSRSTIDTNHEKKGILVRKFYIRSKILVMTNK